MNDKQEQFCQEYIKDLNGLQAAIRSGYSEKGAGVQATRMLKKANVRARIDHLLEKKTEQCEITVDFILRSVKKIAEDTDAKNFEKLKALELLGRYKKCWTDVVQVDGLEKLTDEQLKEIINK